VADIVDMAYRNIYLLGAGCHWKWQVKNR